MRNVEKGKLNDNGYNFLRIDKKRSNVIVNHFIMIIRRTLC